MVRQLRLRGKACRRSARIRRLVDAPHLAQRITDLADGRPGAQGLAQRHQHILRSLGRALEVVEPPLVLRGVPRAPQLGQQVRLIMAFGLLNVILAAAALLILPR